MEQLQEQLDKLQQEINLIKSANSIPLQIYQAFNARLMNNPTIINNLGINTFDTGGGDKVICIANASIAPTIAPALGGVLYVQSGALKYIGSSGTITTIASA